LLCFAAATLFAYNPIIASTVEQTKSAVTPIETPEAAHAIPSSAELISSAYLALVQGSIVPANPRVVAAAALASLTPERVLSVPTTFGTDVKRDAAWLAEHTTDLPHPWTVIDAMARAAETVHVGLATPEKKQGMRALMAGKPLAASGFNLFHLADGRLVVFDLIKGASADSSGLRVGDVLLRVNGKRASWLDSFLINVLPAGTEVLLDIERANQPTTISLKMIKADVPSLESRLLDDGIGYVFVRWFAHADDAEHDTALLARRAFQSLATQGARGLILDLRSSLGGSGDVSIASALCDGEVIYTIRQPLSAPARPKKRIGERCWPDRPIVILVNEQTISAGEALALALRELAHAKIVGRTSGGGLTEMSSVPLAEGYSMTIPTGVVLGPMTGEDQPGHAIKPDVEVSNPSMDELLNGRDRQLDVARTALREEHLHSEK
jgi:C-terminal processing protease CtpA/Prc